MIEQFIVCAAIRKGIKNNLRNDTIVCGARHFDTVMRIVINTAGWDYTGWEQGFIDNHGKFLTRKEAWKIADAKGQIRRPTGFEQIGNPRPANVGDDGILFSENLY